MVQCPGIMSLWTLSGDTSYSSDTAIATKTLTLNNHLLTLLSEDSDLTVTDNLTFDNSSEQIVTGICRFNPAGRHYIGRWADFFNWRNSII